MRRLAPDWVLEALESTGAAAYALIGLGGSCSASAYLANFLPLGTAGDLLSAGTIPLNSVAVGLEVTGAFMLIWTEFLDQASGRARTPAGMSFLPFAVAAWLFVIGLWGVVASTNLVRTVLCLTVVQSSTYVLLLAIGYRTGAKAPIVADIPPTSRLVDPVVQVLVLTDVVIEATVTALLLALVVQAHKRFGSVDPAELRALRD